MKVMPALEAKTRFGEFLDAMQREPVLVTKNGRPVGIMLSMEDAANTLVAEMFAEPDPGYDEWFDEKVTAALRSLRSGTARKSAHSDVAARTLGMLDRSETTR